MIIYLLVKGTKEFPRYLIGNSLHQYWTGSEWTPDKEKGELFKDAGQAAILVQDLQRDAYAAKKYADLYSIPLSIEVRSDDPLSKDVICTWLRKALRLECAYGIYGNGPTPDSLVLVNVDYSGINHETWGIN